MGYSTDFTGELKFKNELSSKELGYLNKMLGEDCRDHPEWNKPDLSYIDLELLEDFSGLKWNDSEKTYSLTEKVNLIITEMTKIKPDFELTGMLSAQGEEAEDRWTLVIKDGVAIKEKIELNVTEIKCPHCENKIKTVICSECEQEFVLEKGVFQENEIDLTGKSVVITGTFAVTRNELKKLLEDKNIKVLSSISKNVDYLLVGEDAGVSKITKATNLGIPLFYEKNVMKQL